MAFRPEILIQGGVALVTGVLYAYVARLILARQVEGEGQLANRMFATWWLGFAFLEFGVALFDVPTALGYRDLPLFITFINVVLLVIVLALWGLVGYLLYLYTGHQRWFWPLTIGYAVLAIAIIYLIAWIEPVGLKETQSGIMIDAKRELAPPFSTAFAILISGPIVAAAIAYGSLFFRTKEPGPRFRIAMVASSFIGWFGWSLAASLTGFSQAHQGELWYTALSSTISLVAPSLILLAYRPPGWIRQRLHLDPPATEA
jgi:hypothetical protein